jgi:hypothetical protein
VSWLAILLTLASLGGGAAPGKAPARKHCGHAAKAKPCKRPKAKIKPRTTRPSPRATPRDDAPAAQPSPQTEPDATATPTPAAGASPTPAPTAPPVRYPARTGVDLTEWDIRSSYRTLAAGRIEFNATNLGEDDHNLSVRGGGREYGRLDLAPGDAETLSLELTAGSYTLYCSLTGHEDAGMRTDISVR